MILLKEYENILKFW